jgi:hypothetical protein
MCSVIALFLLAGFAAAEIPGDRHASGFFKSDDRQGIMQFQSGKHVLGFAPDKVYMVGMGFALIEEFVGANVVMPVAGTSGWSSGSDARVFERRGIAEFPGVTYQGLWKGVALRYDRVSGGLAESVYVVEPGADVAGIRLRYNTDFSIEKEGGLRFRNPGNKGYFSVSRPVAWQDINGKRVGVDIAFKDYGNRTVGFTVGDLDPGYSLIIDPTYQWHTFYGSGSNDRGHGIAILGDGIYIAGYSDAGWDGDNNTPPKHGYSGDRDIVVLKLDADGNYQWHTFWGSGKMDEGMGIAVSGDAVYITGTSYDSWDGDNSTAPKHGYSGDSNIVVLKLDTDGNYLWHTFYGAGSGSEGYGISVYDGGVYVAGESWDSWQGDMNADPKHPFGWSNDIAVLKLDTDGNYLWHTFYGANDRDYGRAISVSESGVYVTGHSNSSWNGDGGVAPKHGHSGGYQDIAVLKLSKDGVYQWHTFYGSSGYSYSSGIWASDSRVYITGESSSTWNGDGNTAPKHSHSGGYDIFVLTLDTSGTYQWHTFYGSTGDEAGFGVTVSGTRLYVAGQSSDAWQGDNNTDPLHVHSGSSNITIIELDTDGKYKWHTFYGANGDRAKGVGIAGDAIYVAGYSYAQWDGDNNAPPLNNLSGNDDIAVIKLCRTDLLLRILNGPSGCFKTVQEAYDAAANNDVIQVQKAFFPENLSLDRAVTVHLEGGFSADYSSSSMGSGVQAMIINNGAVILKNIYVGSSPAY